MKTLVLPAGLSSDLDWNLDAANEADEILWELDFAFIPDQAAFNSYILAIDQFVKVWKGFADRSKGVILYRGSLDILKKIDDDEVNAANIFGDLLHRLASFLPDEAIPYCLVEHSSFGKARTAQLLSKNRFCHLHLSLEENKAAKGILLPSDEACTPTILEKLEILMEKVGPHRMIPETRFNEMWDGLDEIYVIQEAVSVQGERHLKGFIAAGGEKFGAEGFEPPTLCSQSRCASQTALCSERSK
jgi:hypothetical protein